MARFTGRRYGPLLSLATTMLAMVREPRREARGVNKPEADLVWRCEEHDIDVHDRNGEFLCKIPTGQHYLCPACGRDVGGNALGQCGNATCPRNQ